MPDSRVTQGQNAQPHNQCAVPAQDALCHEHWVHVSYMYEQVARFLFTRLILLVWSYALFLLANVVPNVSTFEYATGAAGDDTGLHDLGRAMVPLLDLQGSSTNYRLFRLLLSDFTQSELVPCGNKVARLTCVQNGASYSAEYRNALTKGRFASAWRRLCKRTIAMESGSPCHLLLAAVSYRFTLSGGAFIYKLGRHCFRILNLDDNAAEEAHIDTRNIYAKLYGHTPCQPFQVDFLHYEKGILSLLLKGHDPSWFRLVVCDVQHHCILDSESLPGCNGIFVRNDEHDLYYGILVDDPVSTWRWSLRGFNIGFRQWGPKFLLDVGFIGDRLGENVCFEIIDRVLYGATSSCSTLGPITYDLQRSYYHWFRMRTNDPSTLQHLSGSFKGRNAVKRHAFDIMKLYQDEATGDVSFYLACAHIPYGKTERCCYRQVLVPAQYLDNFGQEGDWAPGDPGMSCHVGDVYSPRFETICANDYDPRTDSFIDLVNEPSTTTLKHFRLRTRIRPQRRPVRSTSPGWAFKGETEWQQDEAIACLWPPEVKSGQDEPIMSMLFNLMTPINEPVKKVRRDFNSRVFVFSPVSNNGTNGTIVLVSFDPALRIPGLRKADGTEPQSVPQRLLELPDTPELGDDEWMAPAKPFHLIIGAADGGRAAGYDFTY
ncbi:uncharacterized protein F5Z01DRAFT_638670 [Emericellopsis atlantica]|uniref:Uncharacterized protein n=1 Tax=Emericellopsis atlantica TaxID=2614577 RepID=A0A9P7ZHZ9_9HYPO|nr:uncharacterized protein F5Z01DRAFT_638670 [Emericellopsis atlantica]KAG9252032.1 hypothetical protein F5Z01DRAFT_638670 [Emericellopsis atlantica]